MSNKVREKEINQALLGVYRLENKRLSMELDKQIEINKILSEKIKEREEYIDELINNTSSNNIIYFNSNHIVKYSNAL